MNAAFHHPRFPRRTAITAGAIGLLGLGMNHVAALQAAAAEEKPTSRGKACIFIFLSGGLAQHESFDLKPNAPAEIRGEFEPIATKTPGIQICEHLPMLAARSEMWAICRSLTHSSNEHSAGHHIMLTGRSDLPLGFDPSRPRDADHPSIAAIVGAVTRARNNLPPAIALPDKIVHNSGRVIPGQFAGRMGKRRDPWFIEASPFHPKSYGAFPQFAFDHQDRGDADNRLYQAPSLALPEWLSGGRMASRLQLVSEIESQRRKLNEIAETESLDRHREAAVSLLTHRKVKWALDVTTADDATQDRYGRNAFGWSLLMARRLVETGVNLVQVNLGNDETWDTHGNAFPHLKDKLFPPTDRAVSALLDDLSASGLLQDTLVVMAGEFGRTPRLSIGASVYKSAGRDHWGAVQSIFLAGGGVRGGQVIGSSDKNGGYPASDPQTPENFAATIYQSLGLPRTTAWHDELDRPHYIYDAPAIRGVF